MIDRQNIVMRGLRGVVALAFALVFALEANAQSHDHIASDSEGPRVRTEWGIGVGGSYTMLEHTSTITELNPRLGLGGHLHMGLLFGNNFALETEIHYHGGSVVASLPKIDLQHKIKTTTVDFPVMMSLRMLDSIIQLDAGVLFTVMSRAEYTHEGEVMFFGSVYPTFNLTCGAGFRLSRHFVLEAHYIYPLGETVNQFVYTDANFKSRAQRFTAGLTLTF